jgi:dienelactone hydrolase
MMSRLLLVLAIAATIGLAPAARAVDLVEPTAEQKAHCDQAPTETAQRACLNAYRVRGLQFPAAPVEGGPGHAVVMAIYKPPGSGPFPALVLLHTCGAFADNDQLPGWASTALAKGYVAFVLDSFTQRGVFGDRGCSGGGLPDVVAARVRDAFEALAHLAQFPFVDKTRIAAMGFSQGARVSYLLAGDTISRIFSSGGRFAAIVAVYGQCFSPATKRDYIRPDMTTPLLSLLGGKDKDGDPAECLPRLEKVKAGGAPVEWHVFDWVGHVWDEPSRSPGRYAPFNEPPYRVWFQYDEAATQQSHDLAFAFLARAMH